MKKITIVQLLNQKDIESRGCLGSIEDHMDGFSKFKNAMKKERWVVVYDVQLFWIFVKRKSLYFRAASRDAAEVRARQELSKLGYVY